MTRGGATASAMGTLITHRGLGAYLTGDRARPGIVLLQEWWGLNTQMRALADRLASAGRFQVVVPDLYHGKVTADASEADHLMSELDFHAALGEVDTWISYMRGERAATKVGVTGTCMGGALTIASASALGAKVDAGVCFYGIPDLNAFTVTTITAPLLLIFGEADTMAGFSDPSALRKLHDALEKAGKRVEVKTYPRMPHAFMNEERPEVYHEAEAKDALERAVAFFDEHLK